MPILSDVTRLVQLVVLVVLLFSSDLISCYFLPSMILPFLRFVPLVVVVVPFCVFSLSEMLNALLISSFYYWFQHFQFYSTGFNNFQFYLTGFNTSKFYLTGFNNFQFYSTGFTTTLSFDLGLPFFCPLLRDPFTRSVPAIYAILLLPFSLYLCDLLCNFIPF